MVKNMTQGQSLFTECKEEGIAAAVNMSMGIATYTKTLSSYPYFHFDLHSGCGWNHESGCAGSPLVFVRCAEQFDKRLFAFFVDKDESAIRELVTRPEMCRKDCFCHVGDNGDFVSAIPHIIRHCGERPEWAVGTILCDPNGIKDIPFESLHKVLRICKRLDVVINWNSIAVKRTRNATAGNGLIRIECLPKVLCKSHWLIRETKYSGNTWQWSLLVGRNFETGDHRSMGFHRVTSTAGRELVRKLDWCKKGDDRECPYALSNVCGISSPPCVCGHQGVLDGTGEVCMQPLRVNGYGSPS